MNTYQWTHSFCASLAHRYWKDDLSPEENQRLFGNSASPVGLGHNMEVAVTFDSSLPEEERLFQTASMKPHWDHQSFLDPSTVSSLEGLLWRGMRHLPAVVSALEVKESSRLKAEWRRSRPKDLTLTARQPLSVLWKNQTGGARLNLELVFQGPFAQEQWVLVPRSFLEEMRLPEIELSLNVKENKEILDALFKGIHKGNPLLVSLRIELENKRKWLIHSPFLTR